MGCAPVIPLDDVEIKHRAITCIRRTLVGPRGPWCEEFVAESVVSDVSETGVPDNPEAAAQRFSDLLIDSYEVSRQTCH